MPLFLRSFNYNLDFHFFWGGFLFLFFVGFFWRGGGVLFCFVAKCLYFCLFYYCSELMLYCIDCLLMSSLTFWKIM